MAPLLGKDMTERLFLLRFCEMCTDPLFHVRKVIIASVSVNICNIWNAVDFWSAIKNSWDLIEKFILGVCCKLWWYVQSCRTGQYRTAFGKLWIHLKMLAMVLENNAQYFCLKIKSLNFLVQLPKFYYLCEDGVWGVRKACAECFMVVSCSCSQDVRKGELANLFVNLLCDLSRWVSHQFMISFSG